MFDLLRSFYLAAEATSHDIGSVSHYLLHRIALGVPEGSTDIIPMNAFPMESNIDIMGGCTSFCLIFSPLSFNGG